MSETYFGLTRGVVPKRIAAKRDRIAREVGGKGCGYITVDLPGTGPQGYGYGPNRGEPFDRDLAARVKAAWAEAGVGI